MATEMDPEKQGVLPNTQPDQDSAADASDGRDSASSGDAGDASDERVGAIRESNRVLRFLASIEKRIDGATKFEAMGVERVPESKRQPPQRLNVDLPPLPGSGRVRVVSGSMFVEMALTLDR
jgi:hypothetical protein